MHAATMFLAAKFDPLWRNALAEQILQVLTLLVAPQCVTQPVQYSRQAVHYPTSLSVRCHIKFSKSPLADMIRRVVACSQTVRRQKTKFLNDTKYIGVSLSELTSTSVHATLDARMHG